MIAVTIWGLGITGFGLAGDRLALALVCLAVAGGADVISAVFRARRFNRQSCRTSCEVGWPSFNILVVAGGPSIGDFEAGVVAAAFTPTASVVSGGLLCIAGVGAIAALVPRFARWQPGDPP